MKKICNKLTEKKIYYAMLAFFVLSLLPIVVLGFYNYPCADDFSASDTVRLAWINSGSFLAVIRAAWENVVYNYLQWSGVFMSVFWTSLQPGIFGEQFYGATTLIAVGLLVGGGAYLGYVLLEKYLKAEKYSARCIVILYLFTTIQCMPDGNEGLYWHAGACNYTWAFGFLLLLLALICSLYKEEKLKKKIGKEILACFFAICVGGGNYLTALQGSLGLVLFTFFLGMYFIFHKKISFIKTCKKCMWAFLPTITILVSFAVSILAPGNTVRMSMSDGMNPVKAVFLSFYYFLDMPLKEWLTWPMVCLLAMAIPFMWHMAGKVNFSFPHAGAVALLAVGMISSAFTPNLYAQGQVGAGRLADTIYFIWIFWIYAVSIYVAGFLRKKLGKEEGKRTAGLSLAGKRYFAGMLCFFFLFSALTVKIEEETYLGTLATGALLSGQAQQFKQENEERLRILYQENVQEAVLPGFTDPPALLMFQDITRDEKDWLNQVMAIYYNKGSVRRE